jgi:excinuclease ABC subunit A
VRDTLDTLKQVGLGYIHIGQQATTLSGGERSASSWQGTVAQGDRQDALHPRRADHHLHFHDVAKLAGSAHELVDQGNTVVVIEHNLEVIKTADWALDLGPEGGDGGGELVARARRKHRARAQLHRPVPQGAGCPRSGRRGKREAAG